MIIIDPVYAVAEWLNGKNIGIVFVCIYNTSMCWMSVYSKSFIILEFSIDNKINLLCDNRQRNKLFLPFFAV